MRRGTRRGVTLAEVAISTAVLGVLAVGALDAVGTAATTRERAVERARGQLLADEMLAHILSKDYLDWGSGVSDVIGPSLSESTAGRWGAFNDVDDFHGWSSSPPRDGNGAALPGFDASWRRSVTVEFVHLADPGTARATSDGVKRITVTVEHNGRVVGEAVAFRTSAQDLTSDPSLLGGVGKVIGGVIGGLLGGGGGEVDD